MKEILVLFGCDKLITHDSGPKGLSLCRKTVTALEVRGELGWGKRGCLRKGGGRRAGEGQGSGMSIRYERNFGWTIDHCFGRETS